MHEDHDEHATEAIIRDCLAFGGSSEEKEPVLERLEGAIGPDLAHRLVDGLTARSRC